ncbi:hypothetical protein C8Q80DRAFT_1110797 [Daedaleopsis nitida]|nr:hypothetical protein C8Q80DRAFT_1110797 [Daedaleopsis nitida]
MSETQRFRRAPASEGSRSPEHQPPITALALEPAFSLGSSPPDPQRKARTDLAVPVAASVRRTLTGGLPRSVGSGLPAVQASPDGAGDELLDLFSVLGLDEDEKWDAFKDVDDSGVAWSMSRSQSHDSKLSSSSSKNAQAGRKRGDTIRASDYAKLPMSGLSGPFDSASTAGSSSTKRGSTRRTRSGTVTQANTSSTSKRKHEGWPTIKMRTNPEPLRADGNEDDELLLKDGDVIE